MPSKSKDFDQLKALWYEKLAKKGFEDIEDSEGRLVVYHSFQGRSGTGLPSDITANQAKEEYYRLAGHFLHDYTFASTTDRLIWKLHSDGISYRKICEILEQHYNLKTHKSTIHDLITKLAKTMLKTCRENDDDIE